MISYFDTSVLLAALSSRHVLHEKAKACLKNALSKGSAVTTTTQAYAELYRNITKPTKFNIHLPPANAAEAIIEGIGNMMTVIELTKSDYEAAIRRCSELELVSSVIYDALHYQAALKAGATILYTDNLKDFERLQLPEETLTIAGIR